MIKKTTIFLLLFSSGLMAQICKKIVNINGTKVDITCPDGPPYFDLYTIYASDDAGDWDGGQINNCTWPGIAYAYVNSVDSDGTCQVVTANSVDDFAMDFYGVCLGTYYVAHNYSYKNLGNVGYSPGSAFASNERGDNCFNLPGSESLVCQGGNEGACFAEVTEKCHVQISQGAVKTVCRSASSGE